MNKHLGGILDQPLEELYFLRHPRAWINHDNTNRALWEQFHKIASRVHSDHEVRVVKYGEIHEKGCSFIYDCQAVYSHSPNSGMLVL